MLTCVCSQNDAFSETGGILAGTFRRMNSMAARQGCRWLWYMVFLIFVFWFFIIVWWYLLHLRSTLIERMKRGWLTTQHL